MISKERALKLWKLEMADKEYAYDFSGKKIKKSDYIIINNGDFSELENQVKNILENLILIR